MINQTDLPVFHGDGYYNLERRPRIVALFGARVFFGQERANVEALAALYDQGCEILCAVRNEPWPELVALRAELAARNLAWKKFHYIDIPRKGWIVKTVLRNPYAFVRANLQMFNTIRSFHATHVHAFNQLYVLNFFPALALCRVPLIYRSGDEPAQHNLVWRAIWNYVRRRTNHFVADSNFIRDRLVACKVGSKKISVIYSPAPQRPIARPVQIPPVTRSDGAFRFVYAGQLTREKGIDILIEAFRQLSKCESPHLLVAGRISDWSGDDLARELRDTVVSDPDLCNRVHFLGWIDNVPDLMRQCHVHVCPSVWEEPYGLVTVEAKVAGIPSIVFPSGGLKELINHGVNGWITKSKTSQELSRAMAHYATHPKFAEEQGRNARSSLDSLELGSFSQRWFNVYRNAREPVSKLNAFALD